MRSVRPSTANFSGKAYPGAEVSLLEKIYEQNVVLRQGTLVADNGEFRLWGIPTGYHAYGLLVKDKDGRSAPTKLFNREFINDSFAIQDILISPTIDLTPSLIAPGDTTTVMGYAWPGNRVSIELDNKQNFETIAGQNGWYALVLSGIQFSMGRHSLRARQTDTATGQVSDFSPTRNLTVSSIVVKADLNNDDRVNIKDWSIFLANWSQATPTARQLIDLNADGRVNVSDMSIFLSAFKK